MPLQYAIPACLHNSAGRTRTVGFELEFAGLDLMTAAEAVARAIKGRVQEDTQAECKVVHPDLGSFNIELDWAFAKNMARRQLDDALPPDTTLVTLMTDLARQVVPLELVCPPIPITRLELLDPVVESLRQSGALGTSESLVYAFGMHINPEVPEVTPQVLVAYLQAYCVAQGWLVKLHEVDPMRRLTPYIDSYPRRYVQKVMAYTSLTSLHQVMDDYLAHNPTRNRGLDMLPLFKHIDEARVIAAVSDERVKARPTFHYRLPNCEIEKPGWRPAESWNAWCVLEYLVSHPVELEAMCGQWLHYHHNLINFKEEPWHHELTSIHQDLLSA
ncbi:MAG TPA: amidoligase family protein [Limnobacter sp.]|nr:amidoligase family protein [Limnobacter sp.]